MNYRIKLSNKTERVLKKLKRSGTFNPFALNTILRCLQNGEALPERYKDHQLHGEFAQLRECHLSFNLLLLYKRNEETRIITIADIGTHPELFGE